MSKVDFIFLHGFLGIPSDWDQIITELKKELASSAVEGVYHRVDYFNRPNLSPKQLLDKVADEFIHWINGNTTHKRKVLVGYSLGGRLGLHIFEKRPDLFERFFCISAHPGFKPFQEDEIKERATKDQFWAEMFLHQNWNEVVKKWNEQSVFEDSVTEPERDGSNYRRDLLAKALVNWSLAKQSEKRMVIRRHSKKISWIIGERDKKFIEMTRALLKEIQDLEIEIIPSSGHRVLFDNPLELSRRISSSVFP
jgi:2-succinyl-6-hydroxy-2,4-cyclohexadiene-1-carboxylate synthase